jgi:MFS family permease
VDGVLLVVAFVVTTSWNGVAMAAAAAFAPDGRTGATIGMLTTANAAACAISPIVLGSVLEHVGWSWFPVALVVVLAAGWACLHALGRTEVRALSPA